MTTHHRLRASSMLTSLALLYTPLPALSEDLIIDNGESPELTSPGTVFDRVAVGNLNPDQSLTVSGLGQVLSTELGIGLSPESDNNIVTVTGPDARWHVDGDGGESLLEGGVFVGYEGSGNQLVVLDGARIAANAVTVAFFGSSTGNSIRVAGKGSELSVADGLMLGQLNGGNTLLVEDGASLVSGWASVGYLGGTDNRVTVSGDGSSWKIGQNPLDIPTLFVGVSGSSDNTLTIEDGGLLEAFESVFVGATEDADGNAIIVTGAGSALLVHDHLVIGDGGDGNALTVNDGGRVETGIGAFIGGTTSSAVPSNGNYADVTGQGSSWEVAGDLAIGGYAPDVKESLPLPAGNYLQVSDGGSVTQTDGDTFIGAAAMATVAATERGDTPPVNSLIVTGAGASFSTGGAVNVRSNGALSAGPGASIHAASLSLAEGSLLEVYVSDGAASRIEIDGMAQLNGTLHATIGGALGGNRYTVLSAAETSGNFQDFGYDIETGFATVLGYEVTGTTVDLLFASDFTGLTGLNENQRNTASAIDRFFNSGGELGGGFSGLFGLSEQDLSRALSEMSGEVGATGGAQAVEQANTSFLSLMTRTRVNPSSGGQTAAARVGDVTVQPAADTAAQGGGWSMWGAVFGGTAELPEDSAKGSHDTDTSAIGIATGWDHALSADTVLGFALAGGATDWDLGGAMGSGDSTFLQLGANASHRMGASYLSLAGAYAWHAMSTERHVTLPVSERLEADFNTNALAGRVEGGHRFGGGSALGLTPYAALQAQAIFVPEYDEDGTLGAGSFALSYDSQTATAMRGELGLGLDAALGSGRLWGRAAWAHDWNSDGNVDAAFQSLPGASFTVNGAESPEDIALVSLGAELGVTDFGLLSASFDGEFGQDYESYAGTLSLGFRW